MSLGSRSVTDQFSTADRRALAAVATQFFVNGALFASFVPRLPEIRDRVDIGIADIGALMSIAGATGLLGSALVSPAIHRFGTRRVMIGASAIVCAALIVVGIATSPIVLLAGLIGMLMFDVLVDVPMNMQGSWLSARRHAPVMNRLHGLWSLGTVIGGFAASRVAAGGVSITTHLFAASAILFGMVLVVSRWVLREDEHPEPVEPATPPSPRRRWRMSPTLFLFLCVGLFAVAIEQTTSDWAAFRLTDDFAASAGFAGFAYVAVTSGMTIGRFTGDWMAQRLGGTRLLQLAIAASGVGLTLAALVPNRYVVLVGYFIAGFGGATMLPKLYDDAAKLPGRSGAGLSALTAGIRTAALGAPVLAGVLASTSLSVGAAVAIVTLPSVIGFWITTQILDRYVRAGGQ